MSDRRDVQAIDKFDEIFNGIINALNITEPNKTELIDRFKSLNDKEKYELLSGIVEGSSRDFSEEYKSLLYNDRKLNQFGINKGYSDTPNWKELKKELSELQVNSLIKKKNITEQDNAPELFGMLRNVLSPVNKIGRTDNSTELDPRYAREYARDAVSARAPASARVPGATSARASGIGSASARASVPGSTDRFLSSNPFVTPADQLSRVIDQRTAESRKKSEEYIESQQTGQSTGQSYIKYLKYKKKYLQLKYKN